MEGADRVGGQLRRDKECPLSGVTKSGRVWRKVPERDAHSVLPTIRGNVRKFPFHILFVVLFCCGFCLFYFVLVFVCVGGRLCG